MMRGIKRSLAISSLPLALLIGAVPARASDTLTITLIPGADVIGWQDYGATKKEALAAKCKDPTNITDLEVGSQIKVTNESGKTVGLGRLKWKPTSKPRDALASTDVEEIQYALEDPRTRWSVKCGLYASFSVGSASFYTVTIDDQISGEYTASELRKGNWKMILTYNG
jgi:hypothetical protein